MKPHPKIRKTIKWAGAAVTVVLVVVWVGSRWYELSYAPANQGFGFAGGTAFLYRSTTPASADPPSAFSNWRLFESRAPTWQGWWFYPSWPLGFDWYFCPAWMLAVVAFVPTATAWRLDARATRRLRIGRCRKCNYNRLGLPAGVVCPECGSNPGVEVTASTMNDRPAAD